MSAEFFSGTNVLVYLLDATDRCKHKLAETVVRKAMATGNACISSQVGQECLNVALCKAAVPLSPDAARA